MTDIEFAGDTYSEQDCAEFFVEGLQHPSTPPRERITQNANLADRSVFAISATFHNLGVANVRGALPVDVNVYVPTSPAMEPVIELRRTWQDLSGGIVHNTEYHTAVSLKEGPAAQRAILASFFSQSAKAAACVKGHEAKAKTLDELACRLA